MLQTTLNRAGELRAVVNRLESWWPQRGTPEWNAFDQKQKEIQTRVEGATQAIFQAERREFYILCMSEQEEREKRVSDPLPPEWQYLRPEWEAVQPVVAAPPPGILHEIENPNVDADWTLAAFLPESSS